MRLSLHARCPRMIRVEVRQWEAPLCAITTTGHLCRRTYPSLRADMALSGPDLRKAHQARCALKCRLPLHTPILLPPWPRRPEILLGAIPRPISVTFKVGRRTSLHSRLVNPPRCVRRRQNVDPSPLVKINGFATASAPIP